MVTPLADEFSRIFREEHRQVRDTLLDLIEAFRDRDRERVRSLLGRAASLTGPHFRYEEEALYPAVVGIFGEAYVEQLYGDHDRAIAGAARLVELAGTEALADEAVAEATGLIRGILPHVSDCEGLSIMVEVLDAERVGEILEARERSNQAGLDLLTWANDVRGRAFAEPA